MECVPVVEKVCVNVAVAPAPTSVVPTVVAPAGTAATVPMVFVPSLNTTFPVAPVALLLCDVINAVRVTGVAVVTPLDGLGVTPVAVTAGVTIIGSFTEVVMAL